MQLCEQHQDALSSVGYFIPISLNQFAKNINIYIKCFHPFKLARRSN